MSIQGAKSCMLCRDISPCTYSTAVFIMSVGALIQMLMRVDLIKVFKSKSLMLAMGMFALICVTRVPRQWPGPLELPTSTMNLKR